MNYSLLGVYYLCMPMNILDFCHGAQFNSLEKVLFFQILLLLFAGRKPSNSQSWANRSPLRGKTRLCPPPSASRVRGFLVRLAGSGAARSRTEQAAL